MPGENLRFRQEQYDILLEGAESWNKWRTENNLTEIYLEGADFSNAKLDGVNLVGAHLVGAKFFQASLREAELSHAYLESSDLRGANLTEAELHDSVLEGANLSYANLKSADLFSANLEGSNLEYANLEDADLHESNLNFAKLVSCEGIEFDSTMIRNARFSPYAPDLWSVLRRTYTGHRVALNIVFFMAFISPYILKTIFWVGINKQQATNISVLSEAQLQAASNTVSNYALCLSNECTPYEVWEMVLGLDQAPFFWILTLLLIIYNFLKIGLTLLITPMREEEERSGHTPSLNPPFYLDASNENNIKTVKRLTHYLQAYGWLKWPHRLISALFWVAVCAFVVHGYEWLVLSVYLPKI